MPFSLDMEPAQMRESLNAIMQWQARILGGEGGGRTELPSENVVVSLQFPIIKAGQSGNVQEAALYREEGGRQILDVAIGMDTHQLEGVLPRNGNVAIWVTGLECFVDGMIFNDKGRALFTVSTSGAYANGFRPDKTYNFISRPISGSYGYEPSGKVVIPWKIHTDAYMMPTLFTQWFIEAEEHGGDLSKAARLTMKFTVVFRKP